MTDIEKQKQPKRKKTKLKVYLFNNNITQHDIRKFSYLSGGAVSKLVSTGLGNRSTKKLVSIFLKMSENEFENLLKFEK